MDQAVWTLALVHAGGSMRTPMSFFWNGRRTPGRIVLKFCVAYGASFAQLSAETVRLESHDVIRGTASDRFFKEVVFSVT